MSKVLCAHCQQEFIHINKHRCWTKINNERDSLTARTIAAETRVHELEKQMEKMTMNEPQTINNFTNCIFISTDQEVKKIDSAFGLFLDQVKPFLKLIKDNTNRSDIMSKTIEWGQSHPNSHVRFLTDKVLSKNKNFHEIVLKKLTMFYQSK